MNRDWGYIWFSLCAGSCLLALAVMIVVFTLRLLGWQP